jgi:hypothetical protein
MRERELKEQTFAKNTFGRFVKRHGITRKIMPIDPIRLIESQHIKRSNIFVVSLERDGRNYMSFMEFDRVFEFLPEVEDALEYVANELAFLRRFEGDTPGLAEFMGVDPGDPRLQDTLAGLRTDDATFRTLVGEDAYQEFLTITEARGPLPEGA